GPSEPTKRSRPQSLRPVSLSTGWDTACRAVLPVEGLGRSDHRLQSDGSRWPEDRCRRNSGNSMGSPTWVWSHSPSRQLAELLRWRAAPRTQDPVAGRSRRLDATSSRAIDRARYRTASARTPGTRGQGHLAAGLRGDGRDVRTVAALQDPRVNRAL